MLFDLRSKRRRSAVRVVYVFLALIMLSGLVLVGVGTGNNNGGLLNAFTNNGSNSGQFQAVDQAIKSAIKQTQKTPNSASAWSTLLGARYSAASTGTNYNSTTGEYSKGGKDQLKAGVAAWQKYLSVTHDKPEVGVSILAAHIYQALGQWGDASTTWQYVIASEGPGTANAAKGYLCTALTSYAAGYKSKGALAGAEALKLSPKASQLELKSDLTAAKGSASTAQTYASSEC